MAYQRLNWTHQRQTELLKANSEPSMRKSRSAPRRGCLKQAALRNCSFMVFSVHIDLDFSRKHQCSLQSCTFVRHIVGIFLLFRPPKRRPAPSLLQRPLPENGVRFHMQWRCFSVMDGRFGPPWLHSPSEVNETNRRMVSRLWCLMWEGGTMQMAEQCEDAPFSLPLPSHSWMMMMMISLHSYRATFPQRSGLDFLSCWEVVLNYIDMAIAEVAS